jgi:hypothetical protein
MHASDFGPRNRRIRMRPFVMSDSAKSRTGLQTINVFQTRQSTVRPMSSVFLSYVVSFPTFGRRFDSHRSLHKLRFNCPDAANLPKSSGKVVRLGLNLD